MLEESVHSQSTLFGFDLIHHTQPYTAMYIGSYFGIFINKNFSRSPNAVTWIFIFFKIDTIHLLDWLVLVIN